MITIISILVCVTLIPFLNSIFIKILFSYFFYQSIYSIIILLLYCISCKHLVTVYSILFYVIYLHLLLHITISLTYFYVNKYFFFFNPKLLFYGFLDGFFIDASFFYCIPLTYACLSLIMLLILIISEIFLGILI